MTFWLVMLAAGAITFLTRLSFIAAEGKLALPRWFRALLPYVPVATLTAIIAPELVRPGGEWAVTLANDRLVAGAIAIAVAALTRRPLATITAGFVALVALA